MIKTDENGHGFLQLNGLTLRKYNGGASYSGGNGYKGNSTSHVIEMPASTTDVAGDIITNYYITQNYFI